MSKQTFEMAEKITEDFMVTKKKLRNVRKGQTILHIDGKPAKIAEHYIQPKDDYGYSYGMSFEGDRIPYAGRPDEITTVLIPIPKIGDGATIQVGSDRYPATVIAVSPTASVITIQMDSYKRTDSNGMSEQQTYEYERNEQGGIRKCHWQPKRGMWVQGIAPVGFGFRNAYQDPSF